jgi:16S rRNA (cytosine1402-N4)-methyltransferase
MDPTKGMSAADLLQTLDVRELEMVFRDYGEEPKARILAQLVVKARMESPFLTTLQFAKFVEDNLFYPGPSKKHIATRAFQALRIAVNAELDELTALIDGAFEALKPGGRLAVISFHSLEDRIVKRRFTELAARSTDAVSRSLPLTDDELDRRFPVKAKLIKPFPVAAGDEEQRMNPRARSAKLRVVEKK